MYMGICGWRKGESRFWKKRIGRPGGPPRGTGMIAPCSFLVEQSEFGIDGGSCVLQFIAVTGDAERNSLSGDYIQDGLGKISFERETSASVLRCRSRNDRAGFLLRRVRLWCRDCRPGFARLFM